MTLYETGSDVLLKGHAARYKDYLFGEGTNLKFGMHNWMYIKMCRSS